MGGWGMGDGNGDWEELGNGKSGYWQVGDKMIKVVLWVDGF